MQSVPLARSDTAASSCASASTMLPATMWPEPATAAPDIKASAAIKVRRRRRWSRCRAAAAQKLRFVHRCFLCSSFDDGGAEPLHQDKPSAGLGAAVCRRRHGNYLSTSHHYGHAQPVCVVQAEAEGQRAWESAQRVVLAGDAPHQHWLFSLR